MRYSVCWHSSLSACHTYTHTHRHKVHHLDARPNLQLMLQYVNGRKSARSQLSLQNAATNLFKLEFQRESLIPLFPRFIDCHTAAKRVYLVYHRGCPWLSHSHIISGRFRVITLDLEKCQKSRSCPRVCVRSFIQTDFLIH